MAWVQVSTDQQVAYIGCDLCGRRSPPLLGSPKDVASARLKLLEQARWSLWSRQTKSQGGAGNANLYACDVCTVRLDSGRPPAPNYVLNSCVICGHRWAVLRRCTQCGCRPKS